MIEIDVHPTTDGQFAVFHDWTLDCRTNGAGVTRVINTVPVVYATATTTVRFVNRVEISRFVSKGTNKIAISGWDYDFPEGAFAYAVYEGAEGTPQKLIQVHDGADIGWCAVAPPFGPDSEVVSFRFDPYLQRKARVVIAISDAEAGRGDEVFGFTGTGIPSDQLRDSDGDGRVDIVNRGIALTRVDYPPLGIDPANAAGAPEANRKAFSLEEDCLGVPRADGGCSVGPEFNIVTQSYTIPEGHTHADFQVQSEDPEDGDSFMVLVAINELTIGDNVLPEIEVIKNAVPTVLPEPGGPVTFEVIVNNLGAERLDAVTLVDDVFGNLAGQGTCVFPRSIPLYGSYSCTFVAEVTGTVEMPHRDVVTASGTGSISGLPVSDEDDAIVAFTRTEVAGLGDRVWLDVDRDGIQDVGETGINGVIVLLKDAAANIVATTATATNGSVVGYYGFANLAPGVYTVEVVPPAGMKQTYDLDGLATPHAASRTLAAGEFAQDVDFGYAPLVPDFTVTKTAGIDEGYPGDLVTYTFVVTNTGEVRLENIVVTDDKLGAIGTVTLDPGKSATLYKTDYALPICDSAGLTVATLCDGQTQITGYCSLPNTVTATWTTLSRKASDCINILPFGKIGDYVWEDVDKDGVQDLGEPPLAGVTVTLSLGGVTKATAVTDGAGAYLFTDLKAGAYVVDPGGKAGYGLTTNNDPLPVALGIGQVYLLADFGYWKPAPDIRIVKTAAPTDVRAGELVTYTFVVTNTGAAVLVDIAVTDDKLGYIGTIPRLAVGASAELKKVVAAPACGTGGTTNEPCAPEAGPACFPVPEYCYLHNIATALGYEEVFRTQVSDDDDACIRIRKPVPKINVTKVADPTFGYLFAADPTSPWPYALVETPLEVAYTVEVTNPGEEPLANVTVVDDPIALAFTYQSGDVDGDTLLDTTETWSFTGAWTYRKAGTYPDTVTARGIGAFSGTSVTAKASASVKAVGCGQCLGKVSKLSLRYDSDRGAKIKVVARNDKFESRVAFEGWVSAHGVFSFGPLFSTIGGFDGTLGTNIDVLVNGVFSTSIHTSCSQPIYPGQAWGTFTVVSGSSKQGGLLCPIVEE